MKADNCPSLGIEYQPLPPEVHKTERDYHQLERNGHAALYAVHNKSGLLLGYEAFRIRKLPTRSLFGSIQPAHEAYPADEDFSKTAWSFGRNFHNRAQVCFQSIRPKGQSQPKIKPWRQVQRDNHGTGNL